MTGRFAQVPALAGALLLVALLMPGLAGCGMPSLTGIFGSAPPVQVAGQGVTEQGMLDAAKSDPGTVSNEFAATRACPQFAAWPGKQQATAYEPGREGDGLAIVHRGEITQTARECQMQAGRVTIKYGFSGRVLLGPRGVPGPVGLPVDVFVTNGSKERIAGDSLRVEVEITQDRPIGYFSAVRTLSFDIPEGARPSDYKLFVAFDQSAPKA